MRQAFINYNESQISDAEFTHRFVWMFFKRLWCYLKSFGVSVPAERAISAHSKLCVTLLRITAGLWSPIDSTQTSIKKVHNLEWKDSPIAVDFFYILVPTFFKFTQMKIPPSKQENSTIKLGYKSCKPFNVRVILKSLCEQINDNNMIKFL